MEKYGFFIINILIIILFHSDITEPKNVKLLFDVLSVTSAQIAHAVLFVTKNTLVCETAEDARRLAYEIDKPNTYDVIIIIFEKFFFLLHYFTYKLFFSTFHWMDVSIVRMVYFLEDWRI